MAWHGMAWLLHTCSVFSDESHRRGMRSVKCFQPVAASSLAALCAWFAVCSRVEKYLFLLLLGLHHVLFAKMNYGHWNSVLKCWTSWGTSVGGLLLVWNGWVEMIVRCRQRVLKNARPSTLIQSFYSLWIPSSIWHTMGSFWCKARLSIFSSWKY